MNTILQREFYKENKTNDFELNFVLNNFVLMDFLPE